jgi:EAL domain-containing protein (putative c-di-GMP-specific phosphodiesterase class I)
MQKPKLLVVDDDPVMCESLRLISERAGFNVNIASSVEEFCEQYDSLNPDVVTLDLNLGQSDGIQLLRKLAKERSKTKIILISGYDEKVINSTCLLGRSQNLNIIAALQKPVDPTKLKGLLQSVHNAFPITKEVLAEAIEKNSFELFYQPKIAIDNGKLIGIEALIRWPIAVNSLILPDAFIPLAEDSGLIATLSAWVNREAMRQSAELKKAGTRVTVSVNLSAKLLNDLQMPDQLYELAKEYGIEPNDICIEITESATMENPTLTLDVLTRFRIKGFSVSIDDFGTGYSSLVELQRMPFNEIKIDKSFVMNLHDKESSEFIIVRSIINLGHDLGLKAVAEGVENLTAFHILRELGCDIAQGYYIARPMPASELHAWLASYVDSSMIFKFPSNRER